DPAMRDSMGTVGRLRLSELVARISNEPATAARSYQRNFVMASVEPCDGPAQEFYQRIKHWTKYMCPVGHPMGIEGSALMCNYDSNTFGYGLSLAHQHPLRRCRSHARRACR